MHRVYIIYNIYYVHAGIHALSVHCRNPQVSDDILLYCIMYIRNGIKANTISLHLPRTTRNASKRTEHNIVYGVIFLPRSDVDAPIIIISLYYTIILYYYIIGLL